ncbi:MAG: hypothetical protein AB8B82_14920 [Roseovarius sp.]
MRTLLTCLILAVATPALGAPMTADEFDSFTQGKTFYYGVNGREYGAEEYLPNRRVIWTFLDGRCQNGRWYEQGEMICFEYEQLEEIQCWTFEQTPGGGLAAQFENDPTAMQLFEVERTSEPLQCLGPDVGV